MDPNQTDTPSTYQVAPEWEGKRLDAIVKAQFSLSWNKARDYLSRGKFFVEGQLIQDGGYVPAVGATIEFKLDASTPTETQRFDEESIVYIDKHLVVLCKPEGLLSVPYEASDKITLNRLLRGHLIREAKKERASGKSKGKKRKDNDGVFIVHRLDKGTSGLMVFPRSVSARDGLSTQFRDHSILRKYIALVHGHVESQTFISHLLPDRGDGIRGSREASPNHKIRRSQDGKRAVTHVQQLELLNNATLISCQLETGRTNQIRIHLSEAGHPLLGEKIYMRGFKGQEHPASRLMLHAAELGFIHPVTKQELFFEDNIPAPMQQLIERLRS